ncbi:MAG: sulfite exporter TauE/SafE family protein [Hyphomicrobiaceae bacterium]|nr:sulfite exporter TauE/SafE family protein [Hyphomicrobiaceae bacterium]
MSEYLDPSAWREMGLLDSHMLLALAVVALGGVLRGFTGFGAALVIVPVLSVIFTPREGVPMHTVMELPGVLQLLPAAVRHADRPTVVPMILALFAGIPLGVLALVAVNPEIMRIVISVTVLVMVCLLSTNWRYTGPTRLPVSLGSGALGGLIHGSTGVGGPAIVAVLMARDDKPDTTRANIIAMMGSLIVIGLPIMWMYGLLTPRVLIVGAVAAPVYFASIYIGSRFFDGHGQKFHRRISLIMLAVIAVVTLVAAIVK